MISDNKTTHHLKIKPVFDGGKHNFFTKDDPPYHEISLWCRLSCLKFNQKTLLSVNWYHELPYGTVAVLSDV